MSPSSVFCIAVSHAHADYIASQLRDAGFPPRDISAVLAERNRRDWHRRVDGDGGPRAAWRWVAGLGVLPVPMMAGVLAAGPIIAGMGYGNTPGMSGQLRGMGVNEVAACNLAERVRTGNILIAIRVESPDELGVVGGILRQAGAQEICRANAVAINRGRSITRRNNNRGSKVRWQQPVARAS